MRVKGGDRVRGRPRTMTSEYVPWFIFWSIQIMWVWEVGQLDEAM